MAKNRNSGPGNVTVVSYKSLSDMGQAIIANQNSALAKITDAMQAQQGGKGSNTDQDQLDVLKKTLEIQKELKKIAKTQQTAMNKAFDEQIKGMKSFKTVGDRFNSVKQAIVDSMNPSGIKKSILSSFNAFGLLNKKIAKVDFEDRQKAYGVKGDFGKAFKASRDLDKANAEIERLKKQAGLGPKATDRDIAAVKGGQAALDLRNTAKSNYVQFDPAAMKAIQAKAGRGADFSNPNDVTGAGATLIKKPTQAAAIPSGKETALETERTQQTQQDLLQQIADNTAKLAGNVPDNNQDKTKSTGGGLMDMITGGLGGLIGKVADFFSGAFFSAIKNLFSVKSIFKLLTKVFAPAMIIGSLVNGILDGFKVWQESGSIKDALIAGIGGVLEFLSFGLFNADTVKNVVDAVSGFVQKWIIDPVMNFVGTIGDVFNTYIAQPIANMLQQVSDFAQMLSGLFNDYVTQPIAAAFQPLKDFFSDMIDGILGFLKSIEIPAVSVKLPLKDDPITIGPWKPFGQDGDNKQPDKVAPTAGSTLLKKSKENVDMQAEVDKKEKPANNTVQTNVQTSNSTTTVVKPNIRNQESSQAAYIGSRYRPAGI
jgi:hypothetical protein